MCKTSDTNKSMKTSDNSALAATSAAPSITFDHYKQQHTKPERGIQQLPLDELAH
jgi:hypothetical protein